MITSALDDKLEKPKHTNTHFKPFRITLGCFLSYCLLFWKKAHLFEARICELIKLGVYFVRWHVFSQSSLVRFYK